MSKQGPSIFWDAYRLTGPGSGIFTYIQALAFALTEHEKVYPFLQINAELASFFPASLKRLSADFAISKVNDAKLIWPHLLYKQAQHQKVLPTIWHGMANLNLPFLFREAKKKSRFVVTVHDLIPLFPQNGCSLAYRLQFTYGLPLVLAYADAVVAVSEFTASELQKRFPNAVKDKLHLIRNGGNFVQAPALLPRASSDRVMLLSVGRHEPYKNLKLLIELLRLLPTHYSLTLVTNRAGKIMLEQRGHDLIASQRLALVVDISGEDLQSLYQSASLYLHPSLYEGFGLPVYEAILNGCPALFIKGHAFDEQIPEALGMGLKNDINTWYEATLAWTERHSSSEFSSALANFRGQRPTWQDAARSLKNLYNTLM